MAIFARFCIFWKRHKNLQWFFSLWANLHLSGSLYILNWVLTVARTFFTAFQSWPGRPIFAPFWVSLWIALQNPLNFFCFITYGQTCMLVRLKALRLSLLSDPKNLQPIKQHNLFNFLVICAFESAPKENVLMALFMYLLSPINIFFLFFKSFPPPLLFFSPPFLLPFYSQLFPLF